MRLLNYLLVLGTLCGTILSAYSCYLFYWCPLEKESASGVLYLIRGLGLTIFCVSTKGLLPIKGKGWREVQKRYLFWILMSCSACLIAVSFFM